MKSLLNIGAAFAAVIALTVAPMAARAATTTKYPWDIPDNVRIVQKAPVDGVRTFTTIQGAINSISGASATNRFLVRVMPGTYLESVTMKDFVDLAGSGAEGTVLEDAGQGAIAGSPTSLSVADLTIKTHTNGGIFGAGGSMTLRRIVIEMGVEGSALSLTYADKVEMFDSRIHSTHGGTGVMYGASTLLSHTVIEMDTTDAPGAMVVGFMGGNPTLVDSTMTLSGSDWNYGVMVERGAGRITNSTITIPAIATRLGNFGVLTYGDTSAIIQGSRVEVAAIATASSNDYSAALTGPNFVVDGSVLSGSSYGLDGGSGSAPFANYQVNNSSVRGGVLAASKVESPLYPSNTFRIGNSKLDGGHNLVPGVDKVVNCYDASYNPIPNL